MCRWLGYLSSTRVTDKEGKRKILTIFLILGLLQIGAEENSLDEGTSLAFNHKNQRWTEPRESLQLAFTHPANERVWKGRQRMGPRAVLCPAGALQLPWYKPLM